MKKKTLSLSQNKKKKNQTSTKYWYSHIGLLHVATKRLTWKENI